MGRFTGVIGIVIILGLAFLWSNNRKAINKRLVITGLLLQLVLAIFILKVPLGQEIFAFLGKAINKLLDTLAEIRWAKENMHVFGGILLPSVAPNSPLPPLWDPHYEPLWELCEELDVVCNIHAGSGLPDFGDQIAARAIMLVEIAWFAHRAVWHFIFGGVLDRHPGLRIVLAEQGTHDQRLLLGRGARDQAHTWIELGIVDALRRA